MNRSNIPYAVKTQRKDLSDWVWHLVRRDGPPQDTLREIIRQNTIIGSFDPLTKTKVICFSEAPLHQLVSQDHILASNNYDRLALYGVGFRKSWIFKQGGLPVIYQPNRLLKELPASIRWRHVEYDLDKGIDYSWQREWRISADKLPFSNHDAVILVECTSGLEELLWKISISAESEHGEIELSGGVFKEVDFIPLDCVDVDDDKSIEVHIAKSFIDILKEDDYGKLDIDGP
jgi:hypothetical protein